MHYYEICFLPISFKLFQNVLTWKENKQTFLIIIIILRDVFFEEIYTDSFLVISCKNALAVALNHARFSDGSIANDYHLQRKEKTIKVERYVRNPQYSILKYRDVVHSYIYTGAWERFLPRGARLIRKMKFCLLWKFLLYKISILGGPGPPGPPLVPGACLWGS